MTRATATAEPIVFPDSDGEPIAENTLQFEWIVTIKGGLDALFMDDPNVFVAGDLLWYPVEGEPKIQQAPDILVAFGRRKGYRGCYKQWEEGDIAPQVVFEVLSPGNRNKEMVRKFAFYERYGVDEYYLFDPYEVALLGWLREGGYLREIPSLHGWKSPRLDIRFELGNDLRIHGPDGRPFATYVELVQQVAQAERDLELAKRDTRIAEREKELAEREIELVKREGDLSAREKNEAQRQADERAQVLEKLRAQLKAAGVEPEA
jgi:Uma2 family endonuclease